VLPLALTQDPSQVRARAVLRRQAVVLILAMSLAEPCVSQSGQPRLEMILKRAEDAELQKDFVRAATEYREAAKLEPSAELYEKLGLACFLGNSFPEAIDALSESVRLDARRWSSQLYLGISLYKTNRFRRALPHIERAVELNPEQNETRYWLGCTYHALGNYAQAIEHLRTASNRDSKNVDILYTLTETYLDSSTVLARRLDEHTPDEARRRVLDRQLEIQEGDPNRDIESWDQELRKWDQAEEQHKGVLKSPQPDSDSVYMLSRIYGQLAQVTAERVWNLDPNSYRSHQLLGEAYEGQENYEKALVEYREALRLGPQAPGLHYSIGHAYWQMKRFDEAIPELNKELELNPNHPSANYVLGHIYLYQRQNERAARHLQVAVEAEPDFVEARKQLGKALSLLKDNQKALQQLQLAAVADPQDDSVHYLLAGVYKKMGLQQKAQEELAVFEQLRRKKHVHDKPQ
jgi:tetratricopeptide (TPR) repeat protein